MGRRNVHSKTSHQSKVDAADQTLLGEAKAITDAARQHSIHLRLLGAVAIHLRCGDRGQVTERLNRLGGAGALFSDLDFAAYGVERAKVRTLLEDRFGLTSNPQAMLFHGKDRLLYAHPSMGYHVDVFFDRLEFSHTIDLGRPGQGCLEEDSPTLPLADLLLSKIQIHQITEKDLKDVVLLLLENEPSPRDAARGIGMARITETLAEDWGFWKDGTANLEAVRSASGRYGEAGLLQPAEVERVSRHVATLLEAIEKAPKSRSWRRGERRLSGRQWWNDVESVVR